MVDEKFHAAVTRGSCRSRRSTHSRRAFRAFSRAVARVMAGYGAKLSTANADSDTER